jgi:flagellar hook-associated protein 1 FlgK
MADVFNIANSGLSVSKKGLETTSHNIANANNEGFTRQRQRVTSNPSIAKNGVIEGSGAKTTGIRRVHDPHIFKNTTTSRSDANFFKETSSTLKQIEAIFSDGEGEGLITALNQFFNSFSELAGNPDDYAIRSYVKEKAFELIKDFQRIQSSLQKIGDDVNSGIELKIKDLNELSLQIATLNKKIAIMESTGDEASDLRDNRDRAVSQLSEIINISFYEDNQGMYVINIPKAGTLVAGGISQNLITGINDGKELQIYYKNRPSSPITDHIDKGILGGLIQTRQNVLRPLSNSLDTIAFELTQKVNHLHRMGYVGREIPIIEGIPSSLDAKGPTSQINFFKALKGPKNAMKELALSPEVLKDLSNIATGLLPNRPGDNRVALAISKVSQEKLLKDGTSTIEEEYFKIIGDLGIQVGQAEFEREQTQGLLKQAEQIREKISGVSLDEETTNLMKYQRSYQASAKTIKEAEKAFNSILNLIP